MRIVLIRHGRPGIDDRTRIPGSHLRRWIREYDQAALDHGIQPTQRSQREADQAGSIVSSTLCRSRESAALLAGGRYVEADPV